MRLVFFITASLLATLPDSVLAETGRTEFQTAYSTELKNSPSIFGTAPVYHIIPADNTITFAGAFQSFDTLVGGPEANVAEGADVLDERLQSSGWAASPYVAFSAKQFGFGFSGEMGERSAHYVRKVSETSETYQEELGKAEYSGLGFNVFWTPEFSFFPNFASPTLIFGGKSIYASHESSGTIREPFSPVTMTKYKYSVQNYEAGCNIRLNFVKRFTVIPWVDYSKFSIGTPEGPADADPAIATAVGKDASLFWESAPALTYGIDFAVSVFGFNIHMGGLMGMLGSLHKSNDRIDDNTKTLSISFDMKGN